MLLLFDFDGVLYDIDLRAALAGAAEAGGASPERLMAWFGSDREARATAGEWPDPREYLAAFADVTGASLSVQEYGRVRRAAMTPRRRSLAAFSLAASAGNAAVVTNNPSPFGPVFGTVAPEVEQLVGPAGLVLSAAVGAAKPDPRILVTAMERFGAAPEETFFTDDLAENVDAAAALGITAHRFDAASPDPEGALLAEVRSFIAARA